MIPNVPLGTTYTIDFVETIGSPPVVNTVVLAGAVGVTPTLCSGTVRVGYDGEKLTFDCEPAPPPEPEAPPAAPEPADTSS